MIYPKTTNSKNAIRDKKIINYFFGNTKNPNEIVGFIKKLNKDSSVVSLVFNGVEKDVFANIYSRGTNVFLDCDINVVDWGAIFALNEIAPIHLYLLKKHHPHHLTLLNEQLCVHQNV